MQSHLSIVSFRANGFVFCFRNPFQGPGGILHSFLKSITALPFTPSTLMYQSFFFFPRFDGKQQPNFLFSPEMFIQPDLLKKISIFSSNCPWHSCHRNPIQKGPYKTECLHPVYLLTILARLSQCCNYYTAVINLEIQQKKFTFFFSIHSLSI